MGLTPDGKKSLAVAAEAPHGLRTVVAALLAGAAGRVVGFWEAVEPNYRIAVEVGIAARAAAVDFASLVVAVDGAIADDGKEVAAVADRDGFG